ncbi:unnamed protein product [Soboliphyme baturini]|uniref:Phosphate transporter n=1 Tax=Soboliphyme baturini TaxID=241478 RepID=A0A183J4M6_9BILA|nr:unnamed protein product [Soboliphyme baturini]
MEKIADEQMPDKEIPLQPCEIKPEVVDENPVTLTADDGAKHTRKVKKLLRPPKVEDPLAVNLFAFLQIMSACFSGFAHGGNDVSNAIAPIASIWSIYNDESVMQRSDVPIWLMLYGSVGMCIGLWMLGHLVIYTVGQGLTELNAISGFCVELGAAFTVLFASKLGIPISTTHCKVGSVVFVGFLREKRNVNWYTFRDIFLCWVVTLPVTALISAAFAACLRFAI